MYNAHGAWQKGFERKGLVLKKRPQIMEGYNGGTSITVPYWVLRSHSFWAIEY